MYNALAREFIYEIFRYQGDDDGDDEEEIKSDSFLKHKFEEIDEEIEDVALMVTLMLKCFKKEQM